MDINSNTIKQYVKDNFTQISLCIIIAIEIFTIIYVNFRPLNGFIDQDYAKLARHVIEMGDKHKIFLPGWDYLTTGEFDCAALIDTPIYMLIGNVYKAFAVANIINVAFLLLLSIDYLLT